MDGAGVLYFPLLALSFNELIFALRRQNCSCCVNLHGHVLVTERERETVHAGGRSMSDGQDSISFLLRISTYSSDSVLVRLCE